MQLGDALRTLKVLQETTLISDPTSKQASGRRRKLQLFQEAQTDLYANKACLLHRRVAIVMFELPTPFP
jgi:hypothetical protein